MSNASTPKAAVERHWLWGFGLLGWILSSVAVVLGILLLSILMTSWDPMRPWLIGRVEYWDLRQYMEFYSWPAFAFYYSLWPGSGWAGYACMFAVIAWVSKPRRAWLLLVALVLKEAWDRLPQFPETRVYWFDYLLQYLPLHLVLGFLAWAMTGQRRWGVVTAGLLYSGVVAMALALWSFVPLWMAITGEVPTFPIGTSTIWCWNIVAPLTAVWLGLRWHPSRPVSVAPVGAPG